MTDSNDIPQTVLGFRIIDTRSGQWLSRIDEVGRERWTCDPEQARIFTSHGAASAIVIARDGDRPRPSGMMVETIECSYDRNEVIHSVELSDRYYVESY